MVKNLAKITEIHLNSLAENPWRPSVPDARGMFAPRQSRRLPKLLTYMPSSYVSAGEFMEYVISVQHKNSLFDTCQISVIVWPASHAAWTPAKMLSILVPAVVPSWVFTKLNKLQWKKIAKEN